MKRGGALFVLALVFAGLVLGLSTLVRLRLARGDVFSPYSSLRTDPLGARALFDSLADLPGFRLERRTRPLATLEPEPPRLIVLAGCLRSQWNQFSPESFAALDAAVRAGSRLVITFRPETGQNEGEGETGAGPSELGPGSDREKKPANLTAAWGITPRLKAESISDDGAGELQRAFGVLASLPAKLVSFGDIYLRPVPGVGWRTIYRRGLDGVIFERSLGRGSIVIAGDSYFLSNEGLQHDRATAFLAWLVGPYTSIVFDESHLGLRADPGIAALARRYGLTGAMMTLLLLAALFVWRRMAWFLPPAPESTEVALAYHPAAGLEALLRRAVPANRLTATCLAEWRRTAGARDAQRLDRAVAATPVPDEPAAAYNVVARALNRSESNLSPSQKSP